MREPDGNIHVMPSDSDHEESKECWCSPELSADFTEDGGSQVWVHREIQ